MDPVTETSKAENSLLEALRLHWPGLETLSFFRSVSNAIFFGTACEGSLRRAVVVRLSERRPIHEIQAELAWQVYLGECGVPTPRPIVTSTGALVAEVSMPRSMVFCEHAPDETDRVQAFRAVVFEKIVGNRIGELGPPTHEQLRTWGSSLGKMHHAARGFTCPNGTSRPTWKEEEAVLMAKSNLERKGTGTLVSAEDAFMGAAFLEDVRWLETLPSTPDVFGLCHADHHDGNFFIEAETSRLVTFDFDNAAFHWFAYDLAVPLNDIAELFAAEGASSAEAAKNVFLEAYNEEHALSPFRAWLERFQAYREALMYFWARWRLEHGRLDKDGVSWAQEALPQIVARRSRRAERY